MHNIDNSGKISKRRGEIIMRRVVLASGSPRRRELLMLSEIPFTNASAQIDEDLDLSLSITEAIEKLAYEKAESVFNKFPDEFIIGADTLVICDGKVLGKPKDNDDAIATLKLLSGKTHQVITGVALVANGIKECFHEITEVTFLDLDEADILKYVKSKEPQDKAGSYAIQGKGMLFVEKINGDYYNVVGLPMAKLFVHLKKYLEIDY